MRTKTKKVVKPNVVNAEAEATARMFTDPFTWPQLLLPIKNRGQRDDAGFPRMAVAAPSNQKDHLFVWYDANLFEGAPKTAGVDVPVVDLLRDGWVVD